MAISESGRLRKSLIAEGVPVKRLIVNQLLSKTPTDCKFCNIKRKVRAPSRASAVALLLEEIA